MKKNKKIFLNQINEIKDIVFIPWKMLYVIAFSMALISIAKAVADYNNYISYSSTENSWQILLNGEFYIMFLMATIAILYLYQKMNMTNLMYNMFSLIMVIIFGVTIYMSHSIITQSITNQNLIKYVLGGVEIAIPTLVITLIIINKSKIVFIWKRSIFIISPVVFFSLFNFFAKTDAKINNQSVLLFISSMRNLLFFLSGFLLLLFSIINSIIVVSKIGQAFKKTNWFKKFKLLHLIIFTSLLFFLTFQDLPNWNGVIHAQYSITPAILIIFWTILYFVFLYKHISFRMFKRIFIFIVILGFSVLLIMIYNKQEFVIDSLDISIYLIAVLLSLFIASGFTISYGRERESLLLDLFNWLIISLIAIVELNSTQLLEIWFMDHLANLTIIVISLIVIMLWLNLVYDIFSFSISLRQEKYLERGQDGIKFR